MYHRNILTPIVVTLLASALVIALTQFLGVAWQDLVVGFIAFLVLAIPAIDLATRILSALIGRFSTITGCFQRLAKASARVRATASGAGRPPEAASRARSRTLRPRTCIPYLAFLRRRSRSSAWRSAGTLTPSKLAELVERVCAVIRFGGDA